MLSVTIDCEKFFAYANFFFLWAGVRKGEVMRGSIDARKRVLLRVGGARELQREGGR